MTHLFLSRLISPPVARHPERTPCRSPPRFRWRTPLPAPPSPCCRAACIPLFTFHGNRLHLRDAWLARPWTTACFGVDTRDHHVARLDRLQRQPQLVSVPCWPGLAYGHTWRWRTPAPLLARHFLPSPVWRAVAGPCAAGVMALLVQRSSFRGLLLAWRRTQARWCCHPSTQ